VVDLPTPPLPEATAMMAPTPVTGSLRLCAPPGAAGGWACPEAGAGACAAPCQHGGDGEDSRQRRHGPFRGLAQRLQRRAALGVDLDREQNVAVAQRHAGDHAEGDEVAAALLVPNPAQRVEHRGLGHCGAPSRHG